MMEMTGDHGYGDHGYAQVQFCSIKVTQVIDPMNFYAQINDSKDFLENFAEYQAALDNIYPRIPKKSADLSQLQNGQLVLAKSSESEHWQRAVINNIYSDSNEVDVMYIDYGTTEFISADYIIADVADSLGEMPGLALRSCLVGVKPIAQKWIGRAVTRFCFLVEDNILDAQLLYFNNGVAVVDILVEENGMIRSVSELLIEDGLAMSDDIVAPFGQLGDFNANLNQENDSEQKVPQFDKGALTDKAIVGLDRGGEIHHHKLMPKLFRQDSSRWSRSDQNIGSSDRPHTGEDSVRSIQEQVRKLYRSVSSQKTGDTEARNDAETAVDNDIIVYSVSQEDHASIVKFDVSKSRDRNEKPQGAEKGRESPRDRSDKMTSEQGTKVKADSVTTADRQVREADSLTSADRQLRERETRRSSSRMGRGRGSRTSTPEQRSKLDKNSRKDEAKPCRATKSEESLNSRSDNRKRTGGAGITHKEKMQNEYDWHSQQLLFKINRILKKMTHENVDKSLKELKPLVYPAISTLEGLPGPGELHLLFQSALERAIEEKVCFIDMAVRIVHFMQGHPAFSDIISSVLWELQHNYVKVASGTHCRQQCDTYCHLLGKLYVSSLEWDEGGSIKICVINTLDRWGLSNKKPQSSDIVVLYSRCLLTLLQEAGFALEAFLPTELSHVMEHLTEKILSADVCREARKIVLEILTLRAQGWQAASTQDIISQKLDQHFSQHEKKGQEVITADTSTNTDQAAVSDSVAQTDRFLMRSASYDVDCQTDSWLDKNDLEDDLDSNSASDDGDSYDRVHQMLRDLKLASLQDMFTENGIRDSVLEADRDELKELLKECGFKAGHILEIRKYLASPRQVKKTKKKPAKLASQPPVIEVDFKAARAMLSERPPSAELKSSDSRSAVYEKLITPADFNIPCAKKADPVMTVTLPTLPVAAARGTAPVNEKRVLHSVSREPTPAPYVSSFDRERSKSGTAIAEVGDNASSLSESVDFHENGVTEHAAVTEHTAAVNASASEMAASDYPKTESSNTRARHDRDRAKSPGEELTHPSQRYSAQGMKKTISDWLSPPQFVSAKNEDKAAEAKRSSSLSPQSHTRAKYGAHGKPHLQEAGNLPQESSRATEIPPAESSSHPQRSKKPKFVQMSNRINVSKKASEKLSLDTEMESYTSWADVAKGSATTSTVTNTTTNSASRALSPKQPSTQKIYMPPSPITESPAAPPPPTDNLALSTDDSSEEDLDSDTADFSSFAVITDDKKIIGRNIVRNAGVMMNNSSSSRMNNSSSSSVQSEGSGTTSGFGEGIRKCTICRETDHTTYLCPLKKTSFIL